MSPATSVEKLALRRSCSILQTHGRGWVRGQVERKSSLQALGKAHPWDPASCSLTPHSCSKSCHKAGCYPAPPTLPPQAAKPTTPA